MLSRESRGGAVSACQHRARRARANEYEHRCLCEAVSGLIEMALVKNIDVPAPAPASAPAKSAACSNIGRHLANFKDRKATYVPEAADADSM